MEETLLETAKYLKSKANRYGYLMLAHQDVYSRSNLDLLVKKGVIAMPGEKKYLIGIPLDEFIANGGFTYSELLEQQRIEREKKTLEIAEKANSKAMVSNWIAFFALLISLIMMFKDQITNK